MKSWLTAGKNPPKPQGRLIASESRRAYSDPNTFQTIANAKIASMA